MAFSVRFDKPIKIKKAVAKSRLNSEYAGKIWFKKHYWDINIVERKDIIDSLDLTEDEKLILNDIVLNIEELALDALNRDEIGFIPYVGTLKFNGGIRNLAKHYEDLKIAKKEGKSEEELKQMRLNFYIEGKNKEIEESKENKRFREIKKVYKKEYDEYYQTLGKAYAEMFIWTITLMKPIDFDREFQENYERINNL